MALARKKRRRKRCQSCRVHSGLAGECGHLQRRLWRSAAVAASPLAKSMARNAGTTCCGTGFWPNGRIIAKDIEAALASGGLPLASVAADIELDEYRRGVADALTQAKREIPHYYLTVDVDVTALLAMQDSLSSMSTDTAAGISVDALVLKAASVVMRDVPAFCMDGCSSANTRT